VGSQISYRDAESGKVTEVTLVHQLEADLAAGKLSVDSPIGQALLGTSKGDEVSFETPRGGTKRLEVLKVG
jgi:transcription elongation factor GreA